MRICSGYVKGFSLKSEILIFLKVALTSLLKKIYFKRSMIQENKKIVEKLKSVFFAGNYESYRG